MADLTKALESVINGSDNFCCLCLNVCDAKDLICSKDEASFVLNKKNENIVMSDLLLTVLGGDFTQYIETLENICELCAKSLISSYTFIQTCNSNAALLNNALDSLNASGIQNITKPEGNKSLFISLNLENFSSRYLYDNQHIFGPETAINRFLAINSPKAPDKSKSKEKPNKHGLKDSDMLHNPSNPNVFQCKVCLKMYCSMLKLKHHFLRVHNEKNHNCFKRKTYRTKDQSHKVQYHRITCKECGKTFNSIKSLNIHEMGHQMTIICQDCGRTYKNNITFKNHLQLNICKQERRHSPSEAKYTCDYCNKKYTQKVSLRVHIQFEHGNYKAHICEWCGKKFWAQSRLKAHIVKHTRERNFTCPVCDRKFVTKESLLYHTRLHTGEKPYKCSECSSRFLSASRRSDHIKRYHDGAKPGLECDVCHGKFRSSDVLLKHKRTHDEKLIMAKDVVPPKMLTRIHHINVDENSGKPQDIKRNFIDTKTDPNYVYQDSMDKFSSKSII